MKNKKTKLFMSLSVIIIVFLISASSLNVVNTKALLEDQDDQFNIDSFDSAAWKWTTTKVVFTESTADSYRPSVTTGSTGNVHIAWMDYTNYAGAGSEADIFYKRWDDSSSTWTTTEVVFIESTGTSGTPSLAVDTLGDLYIAWQDITNYAGSGTDMDIFYKRWNASTSTWTTTEVVSTESTGSSGTPSLAVNTFGNVHIAWEDVTDYDGAGTDIDIFYKLLTGPPLTPELAFIVPNPTELPTVYLDWNNILEANSYYVYRSTSYIWSVEGLIPITTVSSSDYIDTLPSEDSYYYVVVAGTM